MLPDTRRSARDLTAHEIDNAGEQSNAALDARGAISNIAAAEANTWTLRDTVLLPRHVTLASHAPIGSTRATVSRIVACRARECACAAGSHAAAVRGCSRGPRAFCVRAAAAHSAAVAGRGAPGGGRGMRGHCGACGGGGREARNSGRAGDGVAVGTPCTFQGARAHAGLHACACRRVIGAAARRAAGAAARGRSRAARRATFPACRCYGRAGRV